MYEKIMEAENKNRRSSSRAKKRSQNSNKGRSRKKYTKYNFSHEDLKKIREKLPNIDYTMDGSVKQLFLNLTKMQIIFDKEHTLEPLLPDGLEKDAHENYYIKIGNTKTMFCVHLDTYSREYKRVYHKIEDDIIKTDGTTTLGGDDKAGVVIMIKMIEASIPGLYYFFRGEEGVTSPTGTWGSRQALKSYKDKFEKYDKCIAFDRKGYTSIISSQSYGECCSEEFVNALSSQFANNGLEYKDDKSGMWCDSGVFMETIPECTNISVGYKHEHTFSETQDINHLEKLVDACLSIDWESLPVERDPTLTPKHTGNYYYWDDSDYQTTSSTNSNRSNYYNNPTYRSGRDIAGKREYITMDQMFEHIIDILSQLDYECSNPSSFEEAEEMYFMNYDTNDFFALRIIDFDVYLSDDDKFKNYSLIGDLDLFEESIFGISSGQSDLDVELDRILASDKKYSFTKTVENLFKAFTKDIPSLAFMIIDECGDKSKRLSTTLYQKVNLEMNDYGIGDLEVDSYDYTDWIYDNKDMVEKILHDSRNPQTNIEPNHIKVFKDLVSKNPNFIKSIINEMNKEKAVVVSSDLWIKVEEFIVNSGHKPSYEDDISVNADDFIEWIDNNRTLVSNMINLDKKENNTHSRKIPKQSTNFRNVLDEIKNNTNVYNHGENVIFSQIVDKEEELVISIIKDIEIYRKPEVRDTTSDKITDLFDHKYDVRDPIYASLEFVHWINDYKKNIKEFYKK